MRKSVIGGYGPCCKDSEAYTLHNDMSDVSRAKLFACASLEATKPRRLPPVAALIGYEVPVEEVRRFINLFQV